MVKLTSKFWQNTTSLTHSKADKETAPTFLCQIESSFIDQMPEEMPVDKYLMPSGTLASISVMNMFDCTLEIFENEEIRALRELEEGLLIFLQICLGVEELNSAGIHRDLKLANILFYKESKFVSICDFGLAMAVHSADFSHTFQQGDQPWGNAESKPLEIVINERVFFEKADVFSLHLIFKD
jgi:serine/threonine protein kinase